MRIVATLPLICRFAKRKHISDAYKPLYFTLLLFSFALTFTKYTSIVLTSPPSATALDVYASDYSLACYLSLLSALSCTACLGHLRSSASSLALPPPAPLDPSARNGDGDEDGDEGEDDTAATPPVTPSPSTPLIGAMTPRGTRHFFKTVETKVTLFRAIWTAKVRTLERLILQEDAGTPGGVRKLLTLHTHGSCGGRLSRDDVLPYVPQFMSYAYCGVGGEDVRAVLDGMFRADAKVGHRGYWFMESHFGAGRGALVTVEEGFGTGTVPQVEGLVAVADLLMGVKKERRTETLKEEIKKKRYGAGDNFYVPVGRGGGKVVGAAVDECLAISTKERVPCIVIFETVCPPQKLTKLERWWTEERWCRRHENLLGRVEAGWREGEQRLKGRVSSITSKWNSKKPGETDNDVIIRDVLQGDGGDGDHTPVRGRSRSGEEVLGMWSSPGPRNSEGVLAGGGRAKPWFRDGGDGEGDDMENGRGRTFSDTEVGMGSRTQSGNNLASGGSGSHQRGEKPAVVFKEGWAEKSARLRSQSPHGSLPGWRLCPVFVKSNDDLRQEQLASQLIKEMATVLCEAKVPVWLYPYDILAVSERAGLIEAVKDSISLDSLKRNYPGYTTLSSFFVDFFGPEGTDAHAGAKANFVESLAAYSVVCYLLQIKDRHNGNILLTRHGHIVHIDFGFFLCSSPGKGIGFETAPFKLTREFVEMMGGPESRTFMRYRDLVCRSFMAIRKRAHRIILLVEMIVGGAPDLQCFAGSPDRALRELRDRFKLDMNDVACREYVDTLVDESLENWRTRWYDRYQRCCVGVL